MSYAGACNSTGSTSWSKTVGSTTREKSLDSSSEPSKIDDDSRSCHSYKGKEDSTWSYVSIRSRFGDKRDKDLETSTRSAGNRSITSHPAVNLNLDAPAEITYFKDTIFVGGLPHNAERKDVIKRFTKFGKIKKLVWPMLHDKKLNRKRPKGFAYVIFRSNASATMALEAHTKEGIYLTNFPESKLGIDRKRDNSKLTTQIRARRAELGLPDRNSLDSQRETATEVGEDGKVYIKSMVFCGSIPHNATREDVETVFMQFGKIKKIVWPQTLDTKLGVRRHKGFAYVIFFLHTDSLKAVQFAKENGGHIMLLGKEMAVERKLDRPLDEQEFESKKNKDRHSNSPAPVAAERFSESGFRRSSTVPLGDNPNYRELYEAEHAKNLKLLAIVREQRRSVQKLEENAKRMKAISRILQGEPSESVRTPTDSVCGLDIKIGDEAAEDSSRSFSRRSTSSRRSKNARGSLSPMPSPIPGRWSQFQRSPSPSPKPSFCNSKKPSPVHDFRKSGSAAGSESPPPLDLLSDNGSVSAPAPVNLLEDKN